ncbi:hypothetical protein WA026_023866 [Henosepilachna vigintioctopunctata]|uniref:inositol-phosphate phosphatase n=1 Tax=Henosepilachna vigintioctopunctata TaxID=420089 RepID=A0AAW1UJN7_9CUCU
MRLNNKIVVIIFVICVFIVYLILRTNINNTNDSVNIKTILEYAISASEHGGYAILRNTNYVMVRKKGLTKEGLEDKVTNADLDSQCSMLSIIKSKFPNLRIISEESNTVCLNNNENVDTLVPSLDFIDDEWVKSGDITIWIDPLDATHEFTEKIYEYVTTMVCVAVKGRPVIGVINKPFKNFTSWAWVGKATSPDLNLRAEQTRKKMKISISRSHSGKIRELLDNKLKEYELIMAAGAGYKSLQVAYGDVDAYLHITAIKKWDICAGNAILEAVDGKMTDRRNHRIDYSSKTNEINEYGLIATLKNHLTFVEIL